MISSFLSPVSELITIGFAAKREGPGPMQKAIAFNLANAIKGNTPDFSLDYTKICFSKGKLALPVHAAIEALPGCKIEFSWLDAGIEDDFRAPGDLCTLLVYNPVKGDFIYQTNASTRIEKFFVLQLPDEFVGDRIYCYLSFNAVKTRGLVSRSLYIGNAIVI